MSARSRPEINFYDTRVRCLLVCCFCSPLCCYFPFFKIPMCVVILCCVLVCLCCFCFVFLCSGCRGPTAKAFSPYPPQLPLIRPHAVTAILPGYKNKLRVLHHNTSSTLRQATNNKKIEGSVVVEARRGGVSIVLNIPGGMALWLSHAGDKYIAMCILPNLALNGALVDGIVPQQYCA